MSVDKDWGIKVQMVDMTMKDAIKAGIDILDTLKKSQATGQIVVDKQEKLFGPENVKKIRDTNKNKIQDKRGK